MEFFYTYVVLLLSFVWLCFITLWPRKSKLPPGPFPLPIVGSLFKLGNKPHKSLAELAKIYGPLMTLKLGTVTTIVVSSPTMAKEVLQKNDLAFSSRSIPDAVRALGQHNHSMIWLPVSSKWRNMRKVSTTQLFTAQRLESNQFLRKQKIEELVAYVGEKCKNNCAVAIGQVAFSTVLNLISNTVFSIDLTDLDSNHAQEFKALVWRIIEEAARPNFADYFPVLRSIDPQKIKYRMEVHLRKLDELFDGMIKQRLESRKVDNSPSSSYSDFLDVILDYKQEDGFQFSDTDIKALLKDIFVAGTDTTSTTVEWVMTELLRNPEKMAKIQAELKETIGEHKLINESDIIRLPYLQAIVKETFRMHPPVPLLLPHKAESRVELCGYIVPKNAKVLINVWTIGRDPNIWENPTSFEPERFLNSNMDFKGKDFELIPFGAGRRICPGMPLAYRMVYLMLASLLHAFNWKLEDGLKPEDMDMEENFGITLQKATPLKAIPIKI
ncbi:Cytochrome p450 [Thalictrum thalictroides]|uniref:Cytochrome p450 n=1 Tax=Thalictrum thalictroides TaxID=46969 RepID=A0A7J6VA93_THATH|nr:Cytochrome p450 [Thalictrum thalictroides]